MSISETAGDAYFGGWAGGTPPPETFLTKKYKNLRVSTPSLGAPSPLKLFLDFWTRWDLVYIMHDFETCVGLWT